MACSDSDGVGGFDEVMMEIDRHDRRGVWV